MAKENLFTSGKDYGHTGGTSDKYMHKAGNPWQNQNPEWETTTRTFTYDDNGQMTKCEESKGRFDKATYTYGCDNIGLNQRTLI